MTDYQKKKLKTLIIISQFLIMYIKYFSAVLKNYLLSIILTRRVTAFFPQICQQKIVI